MAQNDTEKFNEQMRSLGPLDPSTFSFSPIPASTSLDAFCSLSFIRGGRLTMPLHKFFDSAEDGDTLVAWSYVFLIQKEINGKIHRFLFDLGLRKPERFESDGYKKMAIGWNVEAPLDVAEILDKSDTPASTINGVILGHSHFDHVGNLNLLPAEAELIVGPSTPSDSDLANMMDVPISVLQSRKIRRLDRDADSWQTIGTLSGLDFFGDGSLWVLDTPGHTAGHISALVRVSASPDLYYLLASDTCHHIHLLEPVAHGTPMKMALFPSSPQGEKEQGPVRLISMHDDLEEAYKSIAKVSRFGQEENVNVLLAHDLSLEKVIPPGDLSLFENTLDEFRRIKNRSK